MWAAERIRVVLRLEERLAAQSRGQSLGQPDRPVGIGGNLGERLGGRGGAFDGDRPVLEDEVALMGFEQCRGELRHLGLHLRASVVQRRPADRLRAAARRRC